jgi:D-amino-acid dehydrogenase
MTDKKRIVVVGAGVIGLCCARYLQQDGHKVTITDPVPPGENCSFGNAGSFSTSSILPNASIGVLKKVPSWLMDPTGPLALRYSYLPRMVPWLAGFIRSARPEWADKCAVALASAYRSGYEDMLSLLQHSGGTGLVDQRGMLYAYESVANRDADRGGFDKRASHGFTMEYLTEAQLREIEPGLSSRFKAGIFCPDHGMTFDPEAVVKNLAEGFVRDGGEILTAKLTSLRLDGPVIRGINTDAGPLEADALVVAAGAWSGKIAEMVEDAVLLEAERGYHVTAPNHGTSIRVPATWSEKKVVMTPMRMGLRLAGTAEFGGLDAAPDPKRTELLRWMMREMATGVNLEGATEWMGRRPASADSLPIIGPSPRCRGMYYAFGHGHLGLTGAAPTGRMIADLVAGRGPAFDPEPFSIKRYA